MKTNKLIIRINKPIQEVFRFTITPPNSTLWIPDIVKEETNEWPVKTGTIYKLHNKDSQEYEVIVSAIKENEFIEWISKDRNYHCRYTFRIINPDVTELEYTEWVDSGEIPELFTIEILQKLKSVLEK